MTHRRTMRHSIEALESRNLMAGLATPPLAPFDAPAEITDVYQPAQVFTTASSDNSAAGQIDPEGVDATVAAGTAAAAARIEGAAGGAVVAGQQSPDAAATQISAATPTDSSAAAVAAAEAADAVFAQGGDTGQSFEAALSELLDAVNELSETDNMIANRQKARHDALMGTVRSIY